MEGGEEVWTTDKEARGRAGRKQRCMDTVMRGRTRNTDYKLRVVTKIPSCHCVL